MAAPGRFDNTMVGPDLNSIYLIGANGGPGIVTTMATLNNGWCARFVATSAQAIWSVRLYWTTVTSPGQVTVRVETIDATTGKPTGSLYDANAVMTTQTPTAGVQTFTFASHPTTALTVGTAYAIVVLTTTGGTTQNIATAVDTAVVNNRYPLSTLTAADGTTRSNFAETAGNASPIASLSMADGTEQPMGMAPYVAQGTLRNIFTTNAAAQKLTFTASMGTWTLDAIVAHIGRTGTPAGDLRIRIFDSGNSTVSNSTITVDKDNLTNVNSRRCYFYFGTQPTLTAGTYRVVFDSASSADSSNCWTLRGATAFNSSSVGQYAESTCPDVGTPVWTDAAGTPLPVALLLNDISVSASGGVNSVIGS